MKERILEDFDICVRETLQFGLTKDELKNRIDGVSL